jgi:exosortase A-associated hydrolase 2
VLFVPPLGEEMNKSRRMLSLVAQALATRGLATVLVDLFGTGDSGGEFAEADWEVWQDDLQRAAMWCSREAAPIKGLLAVRLGCALAADAVRGPLAPVRRAVFWQPMFDGERWLDQFLRVRIAASMMEDDRRESLGDLRATLAAGRIVDVAGYSISGRFAAQLAQVRLGGPIPPAFGSVAWFEVVRSADAPPPAGNTRLADESRSAGVPVDVRTFAGQPFWSSTEIVELPDLVSATAAAFDTLT